MHVVLQTVGNSAEKRPIPNLMSAGALTDPFPVPTSQPEADRLTPDLSALRRGEPMESLDVLSLLARSHFDADSKLLAAGQTENALWKEGRAESENASN
jgi:hypothetical protein